MFRQRRDESGFRHGMRVRIGRIDGPKGKLFHCDGRNGKFWKVRLDNGEWVWPDGLIVDGPGEHLEHACLECRLPFRGNVGDLLCQRCQAGRFPDNDESLESPGPRRSWREREHAHPRRR